MRPGPGKRPLTARIATRAHPPGEQSDTRAEPTAGTEPTADAAQAPRELVGPGYGSPIPPMEEDAPLAQDGRYRRSPDELAPSDFPLLSLQVPVVSEHAAERLGFHPERGGDWAGLASRLRPIWIGEERFFAVQPLLSVRGEPHAFVPEASIGIQMPRGDVIHYHTRMFEPGRLRGEFFTIPEHEPYAETYVTEAFVDRARGAGLTGLEDLELVFDDAPIPPHHQPPPPEALDRPRYRQELEWELFKGRGFLEHYHPGELEAAFRRAVLDGLLPIE